MVMPDAAHTHFLSGGGAMGALMRGQNWKETPLGDTADWPQSLRSAASIMLNSRYPIALYWGPELALLYNDAWSPIPGSKHPWALGRPGREVWPEIWETIGPLYDKVRATGEGIWQQDELLPMLRHGYLEECYYNFTFSPVRGEDGNIDGIFNAVIETTDRVLSERRLQTLSSLGQRANASLSVAEVCAWATDILAANRADVPFALLFREVEAGRFVTAAGSAIAQEALLQASAWPLQDAARLGRATVIAAPTGHNLISMLWPEPVIEVVIVPIAISGEDRPAAFLVAGANPRRRVDASYRSFFELAAGHIGSAMATAGAYEEERRRAAALAEIDRAKTTFFSNISHEFRTPLSLMLGPLEDALAATAEPQQRAQLEIAHRNALRLLRLVNALLDFSQLEAGRAEATFRPSDLATATSDLASAFRSATDRAGLRLIVDTPPLPGVAYVDRDMWEKIVLNLVSNAFKFTHDGEIAVSLREHDGHAVLTVRDTGVGIPAAELPKVFDRFHRVEGIRGRSFEGSGIGLALVQELVRLHGGTIAVDSVQGRGTTFTVTLPLGLAHLPADRVRPATVTGEGADRADAFVGEALRWLPGSPSTRFLPNVETMPNSARTAAADRPGAPPPRVLLVDDNADLRDYIGRLLINAGYAVELAADGELALGALSAHVPDLLITDVMMPKLDGFGLLRAVRAQPRYRDLPVIMLSARAGEEATLEGLDAGADDYLTKPFSARELAARVAANIKMARIRREATEAVQARERRLQELNANLEKRIAEALAEREIAEAEVQQLQRLEAIGQITSGVAHDFNNLLSVVLSNARLLSRTVQRSDDQEGIELIRNAAERGAKLIGQLLAFSRQQRLEPVEIDLNSKLFGMGNLLRVTLGGTLQLKTRFAPDLWPALVDPNQIEMIVLNLAINARDAMEPGGTLTLETFNTIIESASLRPEEPSPGDYVALAVKDTGIGIPDEVLPHVFEPFFTTKEPGKGSGLGLAQVFGFVKQSGGGVRIETGLGQGTVVTIFLPRAGVDVPDDQADLINASNRPQRTKRLRVLVVDDDKAVLKSTVRMLDFLGYATGSAESGTEALRLLSTNQEIDLVLADFAMPEMRGDELAKAIRATRPTLPVVLMTGYRDLDVQEFRDLRIILKPFTEDDLVNAIGAALR